VSLYPNTPGSPRCLSTGRPVHQLLLHCTLYWGWAVGVWSPLSRPQGSVVSGVVAWSCVCV